MSAPSWEQSQDSRGFDAAISSTAHVRSEIDRIWSTFEDIGKAYNEVEGNVYRLLQSRPKNTRDRLNALDAALRAQLSAIEDRQAALQQDNDDLSQRLVNSEQNNRRLAQRLNDLEALVSRAVMGSTPDQSIPGNRSLKKIQIEATPEPEKSEDSEDGFPRKRFRRSRLSRAEGASISPDVEAMEDDMTHRIMLDNEDDRSPSRRTTRPRKLVQRQEFESRNGKRLRRSRVSHG